MAPRVLRVVPLCLCHRAAAPRAAQRATAGGRSSDGPAMNTLVTGGTGFIGAALVRASSSEVYQSPPRVPTDETAPLSVPDPHNPRYSYGGGKIISELMALNYGRRHIPRVLLFRPHNVYGPDMGWEHVVPQLALRVRKLARASAGPVDLPIQGTGKETRAFVHIDDLVKGVL